MQGQSLLVRVSPGFIRNWYGYERVVGIGHVVGKYPYARGVFWYNRWTDVSVP